MSAAVGHSYQQNYRLIYGTMSLEPKKILTVALFKDANFYISAANISSVDRLVWYERYKLSHYIDVACFTRRSKSPYQVENWIKLCLKPNFGKRLLSTRWTKFSGSPFVMVAENAVS